MATVEAAKKRRLTQEDCDTVRYLLNYGRTLKEIGEIIRVDPSTVGKIRLADYNLEKYLAQRKAMNEKTKQNKLAAEERRRKELMNKMGPFDYANQGILEEVKLKDGATPKKPFKRFSTCPPKAKWLMGEEPKYMQPAEEVPGQMQMDLQPQKVPEIGPGAFVPQEHVLSDFTKSMNERKFQAAMIDKLTNVLKEMIVTLDNRLTALDEIRDVMTRRRQ